VNYAVSSADAVENQNGSDFIPGERRAAPGPLLRGARQSFAAADVAAHIPAALKDVLWSGRLNGSLLAALTFAPVRAPALIKNTR
jgi:hypothetical protein